MWDRSDLSELSLQLFSCKYKGTLLVSFVWLRLVFEIGFCYISLASLEVMI